MDRHYTQLNEKVTGQCERLLNHSISSQVQKGRCGTGKAQLELSAAQGK
jgi:hypothetical protein